MVCYNEYIEVLSTMMLCVMAFISNGISDSNFWQTLSFTKLLSTWIKDMSKLFDATISTICSHCTTNFVYMQDEFIIILHPWYYNCN